MRVRVRDWEEMSEGKLRLECKRKINRLILFYFSFFKFF